MIELLILASGSPRRAELLRAAGIPFLVRVADVDEAPHAEESPLAYVKRLSHEKAQAVAQAGELVLGADTTVVMDGEILAKPADADEAQRMLRALSGTWHEVITGVTLLRDEARRTTAAVTRVKVAPLTDAEIAWYVATNEPFDKAGAYGIQGIASRYIEEIEGNYANVVGLPVALVYQLLKTFPARS